MNSNISVLVVEDEPEILELISTLLRLDGLNVMCATSGEEGLRAFYQRRPDIAILDILRQRDTANVVELSELMQVTSTAVRQRLTRLLQEFAGRTGAGCLHTVEYPMPRDRNGP